MADDQKALPSPLYAIQQESIEAASLLIADPETPPSIRKEMITEIWDRTGLSPQLQAYESSDRKVPMELLATALEALASHAGIQVAEPISIQGVDFEEIKTTEKTKKRRTRATTAAVAAGLSESDVDGP